MEYLNTGARRLCGAAGQLYGLSLRQTLAFNFFECLYLCNHSLNCLHLLTYLVHDVFVDFPWIWNLSLRGFFLSPW